MLRGIADCLDPENKKLSEEIRYKTNNSESNGPKIRSKISKEQNGFCNYKSGVKRREIGPTIKNKYSTERQNFLQQSNQNRIA